MNEKRKVIKPLGTIEYTERNISSLSVVVLTLALGLFFFSFYFYIENRDPLLLVTIILCLQFFFKYLDNIPSKIWKLYHDSNSDLINKIDEDKK